MNDKQKYGWLEIVRLSKEAGQVSTVYADTIFAVDKRMTELEAALVAAEETSTARMWSIQGAMEENRRLESLLLSDPVPGEKVMTADEWRSLSPESRHKLTVLGMNAEKLAELVQILFSTDAYNNGILHGPIRADVERLARLLAPAQPAAPKYERADFVANMGEIGPIKAVAYRVAPGETPVTFDENAQAHFGPVEGGE